MLGSTSVHCFCFTFNRQWLLCWNQCWFILLLYFEQTGAFMLVTSLVSPSKESATETTSLKLETFASFWSRLKKTAGIVSQKLNKHLLASTRSFYISQRNKQMLTALPFENVWTREKQTCKKPVRAHVLWRPCLIIWSTESGIWLYLSGFIWINWLQQTMHFAAATLIEIEPKIIQIKSRNVLNFTPSYKKLLD